MKFVIFWSILLAPLVGFSQWYFHVGSVKSDVFQSHVLIREVPMGKTQSLAAVIQNTKASSKLYGNFAKETPDDVAKYLMRSFSKAYKTEKLGSVFLYRTETDLDHIRLMVKKRKNDFLISFAFVKKAFLFRGYNETDFFQRLFIASENQKSNEKMNSLLFHLPQLLLEERAYAASGFSFNVDDLLGSVNRVSGQANLNSLNKFVFASQNIAPAISNGVKVVQGVGLSVDNLSTNLNQSGRRIESGLNNLSNTLSDPKNAVVMGAGFAVGTMFSNVVALAVNTAFTAIKNTILDFFDLYRPGEKEKLLGEVNADWAKYEALQKEMYMHERQLQELEIALQLAAGKSVEEIFDLNKPALSQTASLASGHSSGNMCVVSPVMDSGQIENLRALSAMIKSNPDVRKQLCQKLDQTMGLIENMASEMNDVRTQITKNILVSYNSVIENRQRVLRTPEVVGKAIKECKTNAEDAQKAHQERYRKWKCSDSNIRSEDCATLADLMKDLPSEIANCDRKGSDIIERDDAEYIKTATSLRKWRGKMNALTDDFVKSDCVAESGKPYCNKKDGVVTQVKKSYNAKLLEMKKETQCSDLQTTRFQLSREVLAGQLPATQGQLDPINALAATNGLEANSVGERQPASSETLLTGTGQDADVSRAATATTSSEPNFLVRGWNFIVGGFKSMFKWFF